MGVCLCKDKVEDGQTDVGPGAAAGGGGHQTEPSPRASGQWSTCGLESYNNMKSLSETVDKLVNETLDVIVTVIDNEPEPPSSMVLLHVITDKPSGWIELVKSLIRVVPVKHPMGASVIALLLDDSPLPTKDSVLKVADMITHSLRRTPRRERNLCVILGCLAEKLAGPSSIAMLNETTLQYLIDNLEDGVNHDVTLLSLIALEKFAQTSENKATIKKKLAEHPNNPLIRLEKYATDNDYVLRQIGFCARWCLDNYFTVEGRNYSYETVDLSNINVMLNTKDVSEYLKISPDGLEARCDAYTFESVRCTYQTAVDCWYYEVLIITPGVMQIGWATKDSNFLSDDGYGIGDDKYSIAFDGCRKLIWHNAQSVAHNLSAWQHGSILGCLLDLKQQEAIFSLDGQETEAYKNVFSNAKEGFFAAASFMSFQQCRFNFGLEPFKYPPKNRTYRSFNNCATLKSQDKIVLPRHIFLEKLRRLSVRDDSCTLCFDKKATIRLSPCNHRGFCSTCVKQLQHCPMCRAEIESKVQEDIDSPIVEDITT
ncbi:RING finger and SPRY domain-containing protein 1-like [Episyrphus balteatus]|uniref:RING finger and SPRY domain-containing protein 1-like n=1 Tax=Episyrphus balteatus TaxID=286459 RepID=UPI002485E9C7|nr:RING finger and SPRY domain-containing protein 1-like [Episyrphus balteatus]